MSLSGFFMALSGVFPLSSVTKLRLRSLLAWKNPPGNSLSSTSDLVSKRFPIPNFRSHIPIPPRTAQNSLEKVFGISEYLAKFARFSREGKQVFIF